MGSTTLKPNSLGTEEYANNLRDFSTLCACGAHECLFVEAAHLTMMMSELICGE